MNDELKPCLFCGSHTDFVDDSFGGLSPACTNKSCDQYARPVNQIHVPTEIGFIRAELAAKDAEIERLKAQLKDANDILTEYADDVNWSSEVTYDVEDYRSLNSNGCPEIYEVTAEVGVECWWTGAGDAGHELAVKYFEKYETHEASHD